MEPEDVFEAYHSAGNKENVNVIATASIIKLPRKSEDVEQHCSPSVGGSQRRRAMDQEGAVLRLILATALFIAGNKENVNVTPVVIRRRRKVKRLEVTEEEWKRSQRRSIR